MIVEMERPDWTRDGADWPNRAHSSFAQVGRFRWHVQRLGTGPNLLLVHGTGGATHSFRDLAPLLAKRFTVLAPDLPGHGFTEMPGIMHLSRGAMAKQLAELLDHLDVKPALAVGHSAGAAVLVRMVVEQHIRPQALVSLNGALLPMRGMPGQIFSPLAKLLVWNPLVPWIFSKRANNERHVARLIRGTGSQLDARGISLYTRLFRKPGHVAGALGMMASWDLKPLRMELKKIELPFLVVAAENDKAVPASQAAEVAQLAPHARVITLPELGHLAHEEDPEQVARLVFEMADRAAILPAA